MVKERVSHLGCLDRCMWPIHLNHPCRTQLAFSGRAILLLLSGAPAIAEYYLLCLLLGKMQGTVGCKLHIDGQEYGLNG